MKLGEGYRIFPKEQRKNNELVLYGICIHKENESISPVVYPEEFILPYIVGILNAEKIADILLEQCRQGKISQEAAAHLDDFGLMKDKVRIRLVNYGANFRELDGIPHRRFLDLAITYYLDMQAALAGQIGAGAITNAMMEIWGASEDELYRLGMEKLLAEDACHTTDIFDLIRQSAQEEQDTQLEEAIAELQKDHGRPKMYVVTNQERFYGANCLLNASFLQEMAEDSGCSLMVYPSSVHVDTTLPSAVTTVTRTPSCPCQTSVAVPLPIPPPPPSKLPSPDASAVIPAESIRIRERKSGKVRLVSCFM